MRAKSVIHATEMTDPGGVNQGFSRVVYQVVTELAVNTEPMTPANWQIAKHKMSLASSFDVTKFMSYPLAFYARQILEKAFLSPSFSL